MGSQAPEAHLLGYGSELGPRGARAFTGNPLTTTQGKILKDEETVASYKIEEKGFVVCVVNKVPCGPTSPHSKLDNLRGHPLTRPLNIAQGCSARGILLRYSRDPCASSGGYSRASRCPGASYCSRCRRPFYTYPGRPRSSG